MPLSIFEEATNVTVAKLSSANVVGESGLIVLASFDTDLALAALFRAHWQGCQFFVGNLLISENPACFVDNCPEASMITRGHHRVWSFLSGCGLSRRVRRFIVGVLARLTHVNLRDVLPRATRSLRRKQISAELIDGGDFDCL